MKNEWCEECGIRKTKHWSGVCTVCRKAGFNPFVDKEDKNYWNKLNKRK